MTVDLAKLSPTNAVARSYFRAGKLRDGVLTPSAVTANADPVKFNVSAFSYCINGKTYAKAAAAALVFSAVHATGIAKWLGVGFYIDANGNVTTKGNPDTGDQDAATEAAALATIPQPAPGTILFATLTLLTGAADWDANTDALDAADLVASNMLSIYPDRRWRITRPNVKHQVVGVQTWARAAAGTIQAEILAGKQAAGYDHVITNPFLQVDRRIILNTSVTKLRFAGFDYQIDGVLYHTDAQKALAFTAAHVVSLDKWGAIMLLVSAAGVYSTLVGEATQTTAMAYTTAALARAALPAVPAGNICIGILVVEADGSTWTANTDDIVAGSDLEGFDLVPVLPDRLLGEVALSITTGEAEDFSVTAFDFTADGVKLSKAATANLDFSAAHVCTASKYLAILLGIVAAGTVSTKVPLVSGRSQTAAQGYDSYDEAVAALPTPSAGVIPIGYIVVLADAGGWTANTDDMTPGSDLTNSWLVGLSPGLQMPFLASATIEETLRNALWPVSGAAFVAGVLTDASLGVNAPRTVRGDADSELGIYVAAKTDTVSDDVEVTVVYRPWPMAGEATS